MELKKNLNVRCTSSSSSSNSIVIVQIYRTRSHENDLTSAYERKNKNKNRCRVYTHCSCCMEKNTPLHTKRNCARKTFKHIVYSPCSRMKLHLYIFNTSRTVFTARNKQKLRTPSGNPFKCQEEVLFLQPLIPPKRFDFFPPTGGCSEGLDAFRFFFKHLPGNSNTTNVLKLRAAPINATLGCRLKAEG